MAKRNLRYIKFTPTERNRITDLINCGAMKGVEIVNGDEITITTDRLVGHLYNYRDMDEPQHPRLFRTEIASNDSESHAAIFGNTLDVKVTDPIMQVFYFYHAVKRYSDAADFRSKFIAGKVKAEKPARKSR